MSLQVVIRQYGQVLACRTTRSRKALTDRDLRIAEQDATNYDRVTIGYYDVVLTAHPAQAQKDIDSVIQIK